MRELSCEEFLVFVIKRPWVDGGKHILDSNHRKLFAIAVGLCSYPSVCFPPGDFFSFPFVFLLAEGEKRSLLVTELLDVIERGERDRRRNSN